MMIFKITREHLHSHNELSDEDLGMYGVKIEGKEIMVYESKAIAKKAYEYFKKIWKD